MHSSGNLIDPPVRMGESRAVTSSLPKRLAGIEPKATSPGGGLLQALALPAAAAITLGVHLALAHREASVDPKPYTTFLAVVIGLGLIMAIVRAFSAGLRSWVTQTGPIFAAAVV